MPLTFPSRMTLDDLMDAVLMELAMSHPNITESQEATLKAVLFEIMADEQGWKADPKTMGRRFRDAMDGGDAKSH